MDVVNLYISLSPKNGIEPRVFQLALGLREVYPGTEAICDATK